MCEDALDGRCESPTCQGAGGDIASCMEKLMDADGVTSGGECTPDFLQEWCDTYYDDADCSPYLLLGITCDRGGACGDSCTWAGDGECDDGGPGSLTSLCAFGSDCLDCGPR